MTKYTNKVINKIPFVKNKIQQYNDAFKNAVHVSVGEWKCIEYDNTANKPTMLGIKQDFYNCVAPYFDAVKDMGRIMGIAHYNEESNSVKAVNGMLECGLDLQSRGFDVQWGVILNIDHSIPNTGRESCEKQKNARSYCCGLLRENNIPFDIKWIGTSGFVMDPKVGIIEKSFVMDTLARQLSTSIIER